MALGAAFGGRLGVTATSGPGMDLKAETIGLAVALELPMIVIDVQRAGPSTGMPTKTEQSDLLMALYGRHGESPLPVIAPSTPAGCFEVGVRGGADRGPLPDAGDPPVRHLPRVLLGAVADPRRRRPGAIDPAFAAAAGEGEAVPCPTRATTGSRGRGRFPGRPGLQHRIGGLEKADRHRQHLLRRRQPRADDRAARGEDRRDRRRLPPLAVDHEDPAPGCWCSAGARARARSAPACGALAWPATRSRARTCAI